TTYTDKGRKPEGGRFLAFDHLTFWVSNTKQAASYYVSRFGFEPLAFKGLETGSRKVASNAVRMNKIVFVFQAQYEPEETDFANEVAYHGDFVKDVAFQVENLDFILEYARKQGAVVVKDLWEEKDEYGVYGDTTHTLVDRTKYTGPFLPGYQLLEKDPINTYLEQLKHSKVKVAESIDLLEKLNILIDYDDNGYLLQIFTKNTQDRPTLFVEVIQRRNHNVRTLDCPHILLTAVGNVSLLTI
ncbi:4-hydroxyphenylpyruvate dioxygenase, partial [Operophtera brumata]